MGSTTILRGFKISVAVLDAFLAANGEYETYGTPPFYQHHPDKDRISILLYSKISRTDADADRNNFRVMIPSREGHDCSTVAYVTYAWVTIYAHRELDMDEDLPIAVPAGFEDLRQEVLSFCGSVRDPDRLLDEGRMGLYAVHTYEIRGLYTPQEFHERAKVCLNPVSNLRFAVKSRLTESLFAQVPQYCDQCDAVFDSPHNAFSERQVHRARVHGSKEGTCPLPNA